MSNLSKPGRFVGQIPLFVALNPNSRSLPSKYISHGHQSQSIGLWKEHGRRDYEIEIFWQSKYFWVKIWLDTFWMSPQNYVPEDDNYDKHQLLLGHTKMDSTVRYLGVELEDALAIAEAIEI